MPALVSATPLKPVAGPRNVKRKTPVVAVVEAFASELTAEERDAVRAKRDAQRAQIEAAHHERVRRFAAEQAASKSAAINRVTGGSHQNARARDRRLRQVAKAAGKGMA